MGEWFLLAERKMARYRYISRCRTEFRVSLADAWGPASDGSGAAQDALQRLRSLELAGCLRPHFRWALRRRPKPESIMIDATHLTAHHTAASLFKKEMFPS